MKMRQHYYDDWDGDGDYGDGPDPGGDYGLAEEDGALLRMSGLRMVLSGGRLMPFEDSGGDCGGDWDD